MAKKAQRNQESFMQNLLDGVESKLELLTKHENELTAKLLEVFAGPIGIAPGYSKSGGLVALAIADDMYCLIVQFYSNSGNSTTGNSTRGRGYGGKREERPAKERDMSGRRLLEQLILCRDAGDLLAFDFGPLSMSLYCGVDLRITNGIDIQSAFSAVDRKPLSAIKDAVGDTIRVFEENVTNSFQNPIYDPARDRHCVSDLAMRAWISQYLFTIGNGAETFMKVPKINTKALEPQTLNILAKMTQDSLRLTNIKPQETKHTFTTTHNFDGLGNIITTVQNPRGATYNMHGRTGGVDGRAANLDLARPLDNTKMILTIKSIGRDDPTTAEAQRAATVLRILQGNLRLLTGKEILPKLATKIITGLTTDNPWIQNIWFPELFGESDDILLVWPPEWTVCRGEANSASLSPGDNIDRHNLNKSQQEAVDTMLSRSDTDRITIIQGPPGTGKTTVIATYVKEAIQNCQGGIWLVAKSNVAVINIALKNTLESEAVIKLAKHLQEQAKSYKIITPYDAQRVLVEDSMKETEGLHWEEKVYNVDSFQGNEEDYIIISLVRSMALGFLNNLRRTNVMLTRCKRGMYIVSSQAFLHKGPGKDSIVGELSKYVGEIGWLDMKDVESGDFLVNPKKQDSDKV
ncbi:AAA domain-containing protein [Mycena haematopus]|nr:AAA domain-containing protein [Mycena haematopus]